MAHLISNIINPWFQEETLTLSESTGRTQIEVSQYMVPDRIQSSEKNHKGEKFLQNNGKKGSESGHKMKSKHRAEKKKSKASQHQLPVPTIMQQGSSEREIMDSIALTKNKLEKREEKHSSRSSSRKNKRKKERKENIRPATAEPIRRKEKEFCEKCYEKKMRRRLEKERQREEMLRCEEQQIGELKFRVATFQSFGS